MSRKKNEESWFREAMENMLKGTPLTEKGFERCQKWWAYRLNKQREEKKMEVKNENEDGNAANTGNNRNSNDDGMLIGGTSNATKSS